MSYNLHFGHDMNGWHDLEALAREIETSGADNRRPAGGLCAAG
jgi:hypothetical protein